MNLFSDKEYLKYFGTNFLGDVLELDPALSEALKTDKKKKDETDKKSSEEATATEDEDSGEDPLDNTVGRFLHHLSSPMVHPHYMPGHSHKIYEDVSTEVNEEIEPYEGFFDLTEQPAVPLAKQSAVKPAKLKSKPTLVPRVKKVKVGASEANRQHAAQEIERMKSEARARMNARTQQAETLHAQGKHYEAQAMANPFEYMRRGFHAAFGIDPKTGQKVVQEDEPTRRKKYLTAKNLFTNHLVQHGKLSPATAKGSNIFGENHKTLSSAGVGYKTIGLSLSPGLHSGYQHPTTGKEYDLCPNASEECRKGCLGLTAGGNRQFPFLTTRSKLLRTHFIHEHPEEAARLMHQEILDNERDAAKTQVQKPVMGPDGKPVMERVGNSIDTQTGKPKVAPKTEPAFDKEGKPMFYKSGIRLNVTSDLPYEHLMPKEFFHSHIDQPGKPGSQFYDYTKMHGRLNHKDMPQNYQLALSHTGTGHGESNDAQVIKHLENGGVVASVYRRGVHEPQAKWYMDDATGKKYPVANGDNDDNVFDRHAALGVPKTQGVISGLALKGIANKAAGHFANQVDKNGIVHLNSKPKPDLIQIGGIKK